MKCRVCKCTDERACDNGCSWAEPELCSNCAEIVAALSRYVEVAYSFNNAGLMRELDDKRSGFVRRVRARGAS